MIDPARLAPAAPGAELRTLHHITVGDDCDVALSYVAKQLAISKSALCRMILESAADQLERTLGLIDEQGRPVPDYRAYQVFGMHLARPST